LWAEGEGFPKVKKKTKQRLNSPKDAKPQRPLTGNGAWRRSVVWAQRGSGAANPAAWSNYPLARARSEKKGKNQD